MKGIFVVGDVHGCLEELEALLDKAKISKETTLIFLGDLIDKGPNCTGVCQFVFGESMRMRVGYRFVLMGNHEHKKMKYHEHVVRREADLHYVIPTRTTPAFLKEYEDIKPWAWMFKTMPMHMETAGYLLVHAGPADLRNPALINDRMLYMRYVDKDTGEFLPLKNMKRPENSVEWYEKYTDPRPIVFGHIPREEPVLRPNAIGLDTGCVHGGHLTGIWLETREIVQVKAKKQYCPHLIVGE